jgi:hypothetical protein
MSMRLLLSIVLAAWAVTAFAGDPLQVRLEFSPTKTLPALPVAMRVSIRNPTAAPVVVLSPMAAKMTGGAAKPLDAPVSIPTAWAPQVETGGASYTIAPGTTLECIAPIDPFFAENGLFLGDYPLWQPGSYSVTVTVHTSDGRTGTSNAALLDVSRPAGDDEAIWNQLTQDGVQAISSQTLFERFDVIARYPESAYYRHVAPFLLHRNENDDDAYAAALMPAVKGLPGAYIDGARTEIAQRYYQRASSASAANDQIAAGEYSAKGRGYARQLIDNPASPFGPIISAGWTPLLKTTAQWRALYDSAHATRSGWTPAPSHP